MPKEYTVRENFKKAMMFRNATKLFDATRKISKEDLEFILEAGRLSPSSFGIEQWKFVVIQNQKTKEAIEQVAWNQKQISTCSDLLVILARKDVRSSDVYTQKQLRRFGLPEESFQGFKELYSSCIDDRGDAMVEMWSEKQCYIAAGNMMTAAAYIGIDSCPIEGFAYAEVDSILGVDTDVFQTALIIPFGYRASEPYAKHRLAFEEVVEFIE